MANFKRVLISASVVSTILFVLVFGLASLFHKPSSTPTANQNAKEQVIVTFFPESLIITAEVADNETERENGLMLRESLGETEGMLFVFPQSGVQNFWMKNTLIPLDMIFISENMTIVKIRRATPCTSEPCPLYRSEKPIKYVLEVNGNLTAEYGIREGESRVEIIR